MSGETALYRKWHSQQGRLPGRSDAISSLVFAVDISSPTYLPLSLHRHRQAGFPEPPALRLRSITALDSLDGATFSTVSSSIGVPVGVIQRRERLSEDLEGVSERS